MRYTPLILIMLVSVVQARNEGQIVFPEQKVCMVIPQEGVVRNVSPGYDAPGWQGVTFPCAMDDNQALDWWRVHSSRSQGWWNHGFGSDGREH
jgi:hypothetical protein